MTTSENRRLDLREALTSVIGAHNTETLMESTPPFDWSEITTKSDMIELKSDLTALNAEMTALRGEFRADLSAVRSESKADMISMSERIELRVESIVGRRLLTTTLALISVMVSLQALTIGMVAWLVR